MPRPLQDPYGEPSEERRLAAIKSIEAKGVKVVENVDHGKGKAHHRILENIGAGLVESMKYGVSLPMGVAVDSSRAEKIGNVLDNPAEYDGRNDILIINPRSRFYHAGMTRSACFMQSDEGKYFSTRSIFHVIRHELSHCAHWHHDRKSYGLNDFEDLSDKELIRSQVSEHAGENPREFVAETRAALLDSKEFSEEIMKLYFHYSGGLDR